MPRYIAVVVPGSWSFLLFSICGLFFRLSSSASNRIIHAKDHASIQINVADVDEKTGIALPSFKTYAICGSIRRMVTFHS